MYVRGGPAPTICCGAVSTLCVFRQSLTEGKVLHLVTEETPVCQLHFGARTYGGCDILTSAERTFAREAWGCVKVALSWVSRF